MGGAPQGPAGTGKTETTKDMGKGIGIPVYVFNCGKQMTGNSIGNLIKGLAQAGAWGCFDEFNTIRIEVLSIVAKQFLMCYDAIRSFFITNDPEFSFDEDRIKVVPTMGFFITMNPGYKGRAELPESIKVQFRPCAMIKADFVLIAENMLMSEGFKEAKVLSSRFVTLYMLSEELLSFQIHYDWRLRAMKSLLRMAGKLLRLASSSTTEYHVLKSALKNFNLPRVITNDKPIFEMLCEDLFPKLQITSESDKNYMEKTRFILKDPEFIKKYRLDYRDENDFVKLVVQVTEILEVRHCMFVIGPAGSGKSAVIRTLGATWNALGMPTKIE
jgi:dynein heavy chain